MWLQRQQNSDAAAGMPPEAANGAPAPVDTYAPQSAHTAQCHVLVMQGSGGLPASPLASAAASRITRVGLATCSSLSTVLNWTATSQSHAARQLPEAALPLIRQPNRRRGAEPSQYAVPAPCCSSNSWPPSAGPATLHRGASAPAHQRMCPASGRRLPDPARHKPGGAAWPLLPPPRRTWLGMELCLKAPLLRARCWQAAGSPEHASRWGWHDCWAGLSGCLCGSSTAAGLKQ